MTRMPTCVCTYFRDNKDKLKMEYCFTSTEDFMKKHSTTGMLDLSVSDT